MKSFTQDFIDSVEAGDIRPALLFYADLPTAEWFSWTGGFPLPFDGETWEPVGDLVSVSSYEESKDSAARGISVKLKYVDLTRLTDIFSGAYHGRTAIVYFATFDTDWNITEDPVVWFSGRMDKDKIVSSAGNWSLSMTCEHRLADLRRNRIWRYTPEDQLILNPGVDTSQDYAHTLIDSQLSWGI